MRSRNDAKALVLHRLNLLDVRRLKVRRVQRGPIVDSRDTDGLVREKKVLFAVAPVRPAKRLKDIQSGLELGDDRSGVRSKRERRIQRHAKDRRFLDQLKKLSVEEDLRMVQVLGGVRCEEAHGRFFRRDVEAFPVRPRRDFRQIPI